MHRKIGKAMVVGAGISGIRAALDLAETGYGVTLVDRAPHMGGILSQLDYQFPTNRCGMCKMLPLTQRDLSSQFCLRKGLFHENIDILLNTEISAIEGEPGNFAVSLLEKPTFIDPGLCIGCGMCTDVCPVEVSDTFNAGLGLRKAVYLPVPHNIPNHYLIDTAACTYCGECVKVCPTHAIRLETEQRKAFRILVVDDELIVRDSLKEWLEDESFYVDTAESGAAALERLAQDTFHLMLSDIKMPGMDGIELLQTAKEAHPDLCVLMMTAYATVETAVDAMKIGALDYLIKPFDPESMIPKIVKVYADLEAGKVCELTVGSIVLCGGTDYFNPADEKNVYGYGINPHVITSLEFERIISGTGPSQGRLVRPSDQKPIGKIAWFQCVGSRDLQKDSDFCSSICCMYAVKEALLAKEHGGVDLEAAIFYMDMRTFGKSFQRYRERAEIDGGVRFERARIHSVTPDKQTGDPVIRYVRTDGACLEETFDLIVLSVGQRPAAGTAQLAELGGLTLNSWGFVRTDPFIPAATGKQGIFAGGSFAGLKDISESVIFASAASIEASRALHAAGGSIALEAPADSLGRDVSKEIPRILVAVCACGNKIPERHNVEEFIHSLEKDPYVDRVVFLESSCTAQGWEELADMAAESRPNRILLGACHPYFYIKKLKALGRQLDLDPMLMDVVDVWSPAAAQGDAAEQPFPYPQALAALNMALSRLKHIDPVSAPMVPVTRRALVVGGGIAGLYAALAIADHGYPVDLVERKPQLGGNLDWLNSTLDGQSTRPLLDDVVQQVEKHPQVNVHLQTEIVGSFGEVGSFYTTIEENGNHSASTIEHGVTVLATGGDEAKTDAYGFGQSDAVITQKELEKRLSKDDFHQEKLDSVVMIQCVGSREEPRNFCSRVCCPTALKHALKLKALNPHINIYILYRDIMTHGFAEAYFTEARKAGVIFIQYEADQKPQVLVPEGPADSVTVTALDPVLDRPVEIEANLLVLATGITPQLPAKLAVAFGAQKDPDGFFTEAESKWRPVDALKEGVFACGLALSPRSIPEAIATAGAAAQRSLRILSHEKLPSGKIVATVRHSLCSLCERCVQACPYQARLVDANLDKLLVNPAMCQGCGECATVCPNSAAVVYGFTGKQFLDVIDAALEDVILPTMS